MQTFNLSSLMAESEKGNERWREFLRVPALSMGLYRLKAGQADEQQPHTEDEVYIVLSGKASFRAGGHEQAVVPGSVIFVERTVEHRFVDIVVERKIEAEAEKAKRRRHEELTAPLDELCHLTDLLLKAALVSAGYHQHNRGVWRRRKHVPEQNDRPEDVSGRAADAGGESQPGRPECTAGAEKSPR